MDLRETEDVTEHGGFFPRERFAERTIVTFEVKAFIQAVKQTPKEYFV